MVSVIARAFGECPDEAKSNLGSIVSYFGRYKKSGEVNIDFAALLRSG